MASDIATAALSTLDDGEKLAAQVLSEKNSPDRIAAIAAAAVQLAKDRIAATIATGTLTEVQNLESE